MSSEITIQEQVTRFMQGAGDALTDDTVARLGFMMNELLIIADRVTRNKNIMKLLEMSESKDFAKMLDAMSVAYDSYKESPTTYATTTSHQTQMKVHEFVFFFCSGLCISFLFGGRGVGVGVICRK